jgi:predicted ArsR family transcriptional regulator
MRLSSSGARLVGDARRQILVALQSRGPLALGELAYRWPVTRPLVKHVVEHLLENGDIERVETSRSHALRITTRGRLSLRSGEAAAD